MKLELEFDYCQQIIFQEEKSHVTHKHVAVILQKHRYLDVITYY